MIKVNHIVAEIVKYLFLEFVRSGGKATQERAEAVCQAPLGPIDRTEDHQKGHQKVQKAFKDTEGGNGKRETPCKCLQRRPWRRTRAR